MTTLDAGPHWTRNDALPPSKVPQWLRAIGAVVKQILKPKPRRWV